MDAAAAPMRLGPDRGSTAERLLDAASRLMIERSSTDISLSDISRRSGLNSALVKYHFGNKTGLLLALLRRDASRALAQLEQLWRKDIGPTAKLKLHVVGIVNAYYRSPYLNHLIHTLLHDSGSEVAREVSEFFVKPVIDFERRLLDEGVRTGEFRRVDPMLFYFTLFGAVDHMFYGRHTLVHGFGLDQVSEPMRQGLIALVTDMVLGGVLRKHDEVRP